DGGDAAAPSALHLSLRAGVGLYDLLRAVSRAARARRGDPDLAPGVVRRDGRGAAQRTRPARDRGPRADVAVALSTPAARLRAARPPARAARGDRTAWSGSRRPPCPCRAGCRRPGPWPTAG